MFTGLVQHLGTVLALERTPEGARLLIDTNGWSHQPARGDSISVNGCCLTVVQCGSELGFDLVQETIARTSLDTIASGDRVNLEHAVTPATLLGGHIVQGHVDGTGTVLSNAREGEEGWRLRITPPAELGRFLIEKGSITIDGVSLTIARWSGNCLEIALIPETLERTTLGSLAEGDLVNLEADCLVKMVEQLLGERAPKIEES